MQGIHIRYAIHTISHHADRSLLILQIFPNQIGDEAHQFVLERQMMAGFKLLVEHIWKLLAAAFVTSWQHSCLHEAPAQSPATYLILHKYPNCIVTLLAHMHAMTALICTCTQALQALILQLHLLLLSRCTAVPSACS